MSSPTPPSSNDADHAFAVASDVTPHEEEVALPGYEEAQDRRSSDRRPSRSLLAIAMSQTLRRWGARVGLAWISILVILGVFAPFIANTRPLVAKTADGNWISPAWNAMTAADLALPVIFFVGVGVLIALKLGKLKPGLAAILMLVTVLGSAGAGWLIADPPLLERMSQYRRAIDTDKYQWHLSAPIPFSPNDRLSDVGNARKAAPFWAPNDVAEEIPTSHLLGTTINGEDMASRMIHAARIALAIGIVATGISTLIGIVVGAVMGYAGGIVDLLMMRLIEILQTLPVLVVLLIVTQFFGKDIWMMMVAIGLMTWTTDARFVRAEFLKLKSLEFVQAARAGGLPTLPILFRHMLPNGVAPVLVNASFGIAGAILFESILSFLGMGLEAKDPSWGQLLNQARQGGTDFNWWIATFPGGAIFLTVFAYILIGESLRDALDPKLQKAG